ncbi:MAG: porin family protein [Prevotella sp.]|jgi:hypothetical protein
MKKAIVLIALVLSTVGTMAQGHTGVFSVVPRIGATFSNITKESVGFGTSSELQKGKTQVGLIAGAGLQYQALPVLGVSIGTYYQRMGCTYDDTDLSQADAGEYTVYQRCHTYLDYLSVPLMGHIYVAKNFAINAGVQASFLLSNKIRADIMHVTIGNDGSYTYRDESEKLDEENKYIRKFDLSIPVGVSYEYENVVLDIRYQIGLSKLYKSLLDNGSKNKAVVFSAGYKFDLGSI